MNLPEVTDLEVAMPMEHSSPFSLDPQKIQHQYHSIGPEKSDWKICTETYLHFQTSKLKPLSSTTPNFCHHCFRSAIPPQTNQIMAPKLPELPIAAFRNDFDKPPEGPWCYIADMDFTSVRKMGCVFSLINYQINRTPIPHFLRPTLLTLEYRNTIIGMLEKAKGNEVLINILRWVSVQSDVTRTNQANKIDMEKGEKLLDAVRELRLSVNHYVKEPRIYKAEYEKTKIYWKWMMGKNKSKTGVNCSYIRLEEGDKNIEFHHGIDENSLMEEDDMENPKEEKVYLLIYPNHVAADVEQDIFSEVLIKDTRTTRGGRSVSCLCKPVVTMILTHEYSMVYLSSGKTLTKKLSRQLQQQPQKLSRVQSHE